MLPRSLKKGDTLGIVSPSSPITEELNEQLVKGMNTLKEIGFNLVFAKNAMSNSLSYSASAFEKAADINKMFEDKNINGIICSQGGENANSVLPYLNYNIIKNNPKVFIGMSDISPLINGFYHKTGLITFHGNDLLWGFGGDIVEYELNAFVNIVMKKNSKYEFEKNSKWKCIHEGQAIGPLLGGNIGCLIKIAGTEFMPDFNNAILFIEDWGRYATPVTIHSSLSHFQQLGIFKKINGLIIGYYATNSKIKFEQILSNVLGEIDFPVLKCNDFGHEIPNLTFPIGATVYLDSTNETLELLNPCVS